MSLPRVCGASFPDVCGLEKTALYICSGVAAKPSNPTNCTLGCEFTSPDNQCFVDRSADVNALKSVIDDVIGAMNSNLRTNNLTLVAFPPFVSLLNEVEANLTRATDPKDLQSVLEAVNSAINSITRVFKDVKPPLDTTSPGTQELSLITNGTLLNLAQSLCQCSGDNVTNCVGAMELYNNFVASAQDRTKLLGVGTMLGPLTRVSGDLSTSTKQFDVALPDGNIAALNESATLLNKIIGYTSGNVQMYGNISDSVMLVYDSAREVVVCKGLAVNQFLDKCSAYADRLNGVLSDFIQFIEANIGFIPVVGPLIVNPLLDALRHLLIDVQNGVATALGGVVSLLNAIVQVLNVVSPPSSTNIVRDYLLRLVGIMDVPAECGGLSDRCSGLFKIVHMITDGVLNLIGKIPLAGVIIRPTLEPVLNGLLDALQKGVASTIKIALDLLDGVVKVVGLIPGVGNVLKVLIDTLKALVDCLVVQVPSQIGGSGDCSCAGNGTVCSDKFPATCNKPANSVCGSSFPESCGLQKTALYTCTGVSSTPSAPTNCTTGCDMTTLDNQCTVDHSAELKDFTGLTDNIVELMKRNLNTNNLTLVAFPPFVSLLNDVKTSIAQATNSKELQSVLRSVSNTIGSATRVFLDVKPPLESTIPSLNALSVISNGTLSHLIQSICECGGSNASDGVGAMGLYRNFVATAQARTKLLGVGDKMAPLGHVSQDLATSTKNFDEALPDSNVSALDESAALLNRIIGNTTGNIQKYGDISDSVMLVYESAKEVVLCKGMSNGISDLFLLENMTIERFSTCRGLRLMSFITPRTSLDMDSLGLNGSQFLDKCSAYTGRLYGVLSDFIQFIEANIKCIPVIGPLIVNPLLDALRHLLIDVQNGVATAVGGVVSLLNALVHVLTLVSPPSSTNVVRDYLLRLVGIMDVPAECGGLIDRCSGLFKIVHMITDGVLNLIGKIPLAGIILKPTLAPVLNGLLDALQKGAAAGIKFALDLLDGVVKLVGFIPGVGNVLKVLIDTVRSLVDCIVVDVPKGAMHAIKRA
ncbi:hypothetical protein EC968_001079 [Mortierella alpina]|nr:hypothetical protein EC968_001079 [Mortierella alpina]